MLPKLKARPRSAKVAAKAMDLGYTPLQALACRLSDAEADSLASRVSPRLTQLDGPAALPDIEVATERVVQAIVDQEMVAVCTD